MNIKKKSLWIATAFVMFISFTSCEELFEKYELPESGSLPDKTPPEASFTYQQGEGGGDIWKQYTFSNTSVSAIDYAWTFGDGNSSTEVEPINIYPGEGTYTVTLTATDGLGVQSVFSQDIVVEEPPAPAVPDPVLLNADFDKVAKSSGSDCSCSGWINKSLGAQGESSSGNGGSNNVVKYDNDEHDATYQEFEVVPNSDYIITLVVAFQASQGGSFPSTLEIRVLAGSGYVSGYSPVYYTSTTEIPQDGFGYTSIAQMEDPNNNLMTSTIDHPNDTSYITYQYTFNSGANDSVALFMRGINGDGTPSDDKGFLYNNGDEEIRVDSVIIEAQN